MTRLICLLLLSASVLVLAGCATSDELSSRPWNSPMGWEHGLPSAMTEGR